MDALDLGKKYCVRGESTRHDDRQDIGESVDDVFRRAANAVDPASAVATE